MHQDLDAFDQLLDRAREGHDEADMPPGEWWWRRHDEYGDSDG